MCILDMCSCQLQMYLYVLEAYTPQDLQVLRTTNLSDSKLPIMLSVRSGFAHPETNKLYLALHRPWRKGRKHSFFDIAQGLAQLPLVYFAALPKACSVVAISPMMVIVAF